MQLNRALRPLFTAQRRLLPRRVQSRAAANEVPSVVKVQLQVSKHVDFGVGVAVVGSVPALGQWQGSAVVPLVWSSEDVWRGELSLPSGIDIEYKYVCTRNEGDQASEPHLEWQEGDNLTLNLPAGTTTAVVVDSWQAGHTQVDLQSATIPTAAVPQAVEPAKEEVSAASDAPIAVPLAVPLAMPVVAAKAEDGATSRATDDAPALPTEVASNIVPRSAPQPEDPWGSNKVPGGVIKSAKASKAASKAAKAAKAARTSSKDAAVPAVMVAANAPASNILPGPLTKAPASRAAATVTEETADVL